MGCKKGGRWAHGSLEMWEMQYRITLKTQRHGPRAPRLMGPRGAPLCHGKVLKKERKLRGKERKNKKRGRKKRKKRERKEKENREKKRGKERKEKGKRGRKK